MNRKYVFAILVVALLTGWQAAFSQPKVMSWGNMEGIRIDGQLMKFHSSLVVVSEDWSHIIQSYKERQRPKYTRQGEDQIIESTLGNLNFKEVIRGMGLGSAKVDIDFNTKVDTAIAGAFFRIDLPIDDYLGATISLNQNEKVPISLSEFNVENNYKAFSSKSVMFDSPARKLKLDFEEELQFYISVFEHENKSNIHIYVPVIEGNAKANETKSLSLIITADGEIDRNPVSLEVDLNKPGRAFDGIGGNFRIQNPDVDPKVIQYCLDSLNVTWARVEMPWRFWHPDENVDPLEAARNGKIHDRVKKAMEMAKKAYDLGIPVIVSDWSAPDWAIEGEFQYRPGPDGLWGNPLNQSKKEKIYESIASYLVYLKEAYGVEVEMFSFNESDLGINVRQTDVEHTRLIKELGAYFKLKGLKTKMLLGDTADANGYGFIGHAMDDPEVKPYIGAVSFHSWRGWEDETLDKWNKAAEKMNIPLMVGEGSIDASAWRVPAIFEESSYALMEIDLYVRILNICQPKSILQWQLTSDYSVLSGGGVFGNNAEPLHPTQRFWNLKQLSLTPEKLQVFKVKSDGSELSYAVLGDVKSGKGAIHLVNNGATRDVIIKSLSGKLKILKMYVTNEKSDMEFLGDVKIKNGEIKIKAEKVSFTSLIGE